MDSLERAALQRAVELSVDVEVALLSKDASAPVLMLLGKAREHAADSLIALTETAPDDAPAIRKLQNNVTCFRLLCEWMKEVVTQGVEADKLLRPDDLDDIRDALALDSDDAAEALIRSGFMPEPYPE